MTINSLFKKDLLKKFSVNDYPFNKVLSELLELKDLSKLHKKSFNIDQYNQDLGKDSQSKYHDIFYKAIKKEASQIRILWDNFLKNVVRSHYKDEDSLIVQALPSLRIHAPGAKAINRWHFDSDSDHKHPIGEINCILPITNMYGNNSLWRESDPNKANFKPFELSYGDIVYWNGNTCTHGNYKNDTNYTRLSLDFRIFPKHKYLDHIEKSKSIEEQSATTGLKFIIGSYYKEIN